MFDVDDTHGKMRPCSFEYSSFRQESPSGKYVCDYSGGNASMCRDLLIEISDYCSGDTSIGGMDDDGSGIEMGLWTGGRLESRPLSSMGGNYVYPCNSPGDPIGTTAALWVNCHGRRYCNEGFGDIVLSAMAGAKEPQGMIYTVFNDTIREDITYQAPGHMAIDYANGEDESVDSDYLALTY